MIREPVGESQPAAQVGANVASSSQPEVHWQPTFKLGDGPLSAMANVRVWVKGEGGKKPKAWCMASCYLRTFDFLLRETGIR